MNNSVVVASVTDPTERSVLEHATLILEAQKGELMKTSLLVQQVSEKLPEIDSRAEVYAALRRLAENPEVRIKSKRGRNGGYFLSEIADAPLEGISEKKSLKDLERHYWLVVSDWVKSEKGIRTASASVANLKKGGVWGNPDVVALIITEDLGFFDVEVQTFEVKTTLVGWKYYIFEAVSHKRFAERSYFVFRHNGDIGSEERRELISYGERFGVGIVRIDVDDNTAKRFVEWGKLSESDRIDIYNAFEEILPAPFFPISTHDKSKYLKSIGLATKSALYGFGAA